MTPDVKSVRDRAWHYQVPEVAAVADMTVAQLRQFVAGTFLPSPVQLQRLAFRMGMIR
jgi:hypothetical protein